ncbi:methyl-accepting chemotaxis protein [Ammoniphilus sp. YIM 78166]|uniref:methyl-accepting chemotaxis protein n=1 Tax=Ammoniphilus sp. YIM 78166 TaxID=1644106 RepID=UPI00106F5CE5|nr:methyl-accepting chemotaxis protein [Ammoniphilus sp. YIM 78166]
MKIKTKLITGFATVLLLLIGISSFSFFILSTIGEKTKTIANESIPSVSVLGKMESEVSNVSRLLLDLALENQPEHAEMRKVELAQSLQLLETERLQYESMIRDEAQQQLYDTFYREWSTFSEMIPQILERVEEGDSFFAHLDYQAVRPNWEKAYEAINQLSELNEASTYEATEQTLLAISSAYQWILLTSAAAIFLTIVLSILVSRQITQPLKILEQELMGLARRGGDLTQQLRVAGKDEISQLAYALNQFLFNLKMIVERILSESHSVTSLSGSLTEKATLTHDASKLMVQTLHEVAVGSTKQSEHTSSVLKKMEDTQLQVQVGLEKAEETAANAQMSTETALTGKETMRQAISHLHEMNQLFSSSNHSIHRLEERAKEIGGIVTTITDISNQTNLLALNAAIEAARAGAQGKGFAVVAEEVRKLADESKRAAEQISSLIKSMQEETGKTVGMMENNLSSVKKQVQMMEQGGEALALIVDHVQQTEQDALHIQSIFTELHEESSHILEEIEGIASITEQSASGAQTIAASTEEQAQAMSAIYETAHAFRELAERLREEVCQFKVE